MIQNKDIEQVRDILTDTSIIHIAVRADRALKKLDELLQQQSPVIATADCPHDVAELFLNEFHRVHGAVKRRDWSEAQFPRIGDEAVIELVTRREVLQWVLEILNITEK
jgi:hypothetical protein